MKQTDFDIFYAMNRGLSLKEYLCCDKTDFEEWCKKEGFEYDIATKDNWNYRYEKFKTHFKGGIKLFGKKKNSLLSDSQKLLKNCYDSGVIIEYEEAEGKWIDLPKGLPLDFSKFEEGAIRLKYNEPTYGQVEKFRKEFGSPIVTDWDFRNFPILTFCLVKGFCTIKEKGSLEWNLTNIWRYYKFKDYFNPITNEPVVLKDILSYVEMEFQNITARIDDLYTRV